MDIYAPFDVTIAYVLLGYELHHYVKKIGKKEKICCFIIYVISNLSIWLLNSLDMKMNDTEDFYHSAGSVTIILSSCMLFILIRNLNFIKLEKISNAILFISSKTMGIYLIHYMIIMKIKSSGIIKVLQWNVLLEYIMTVIGVYTVALLFFVYGKY